MSSTKTLLKTRAAAPQVSTVQAVAAQAAEAVPEVEEDQTVANASTEDAKKQRNPYIPRTVSEFEREANSIADTLRSMKAALYPTSAQKATGTPPTRRELDELGTKVKALIRDYKTVNRKLESKPKRKSAPSDGKTRSGGFKNPCMVDDALAQFIAEHINSDTNAVMDDSCITTRAILTSCMTQYAYDHQLRDAADPTKIRPNAPLLALFGNDFAEAKVDPNGFPHTHMQKLLTRHVLSSADFEAKRKEKGITDEQLTEYRAHLDTIQEHYKSLKSIREANKPKKAPKAKKAAVAPAEPVAA